jgi:hypothetical protein
VRLGTSSAQDQAGDVHSTPATSTRSYDILGNMQYEPEYEIDIPGNMAYEPEQEFDRDLGQRVYEFRDITDVTEGDNVDRIFVSDLEARSQQTWTLSREAREPYSQHLQSPVFYSGQSSELHGIEPSDNWATSYTQQNSNDYHQHSDQIHYDEIVPHQPLWYTNHEPIQLTQSAASHQPPWYINSGSGQLTQSAVSAQNLSLVDLDRSRQSEDESEEPWSTYRTSGSILLGPQSFSDVRPPTPLATIFTSGFHNYLGPELDSTMSQMVENTAPSVSLTPSITSSTVPDVLHCSHVGCSATFRGQHRRGALLRHMRQKHSTVIKEEKPKTYPCLVSGCEREFQRWDARLKHYRSRHRRIAPSRSPLRHPGIQRAFQRDTDATERRQAIHPADYSLQRDESLGESSSEAVYMSDHITDGTKLMTAHIGVQAHHQISGASHDSPRRADDLDDGQSQRAIVDHDRWHGDPELCERHNISEDDWEAAWKGPRQADAPGVYGETIDRGSTGYVVPRHASHVLEDPESVQNETTRDGPETILKREDEHITDDIKLFHQTETREGPRSLPYDDQERAVPQPSRFLSASFGGLAYLLADLTLGSLGSKTRKTPSAQLQPEDGNTSASTADNENNGGIAKHATDGGGTKNNSSFAVGDEEAGNTSRSSDGNSTGSKRSGGGAPNDEDDNKKRKRRTRFQRNGDGTADDMYACPFPKNDPRKHYRCFDFVFNKKKFGDLK